MTADRGWGDPGADPPWEWHRPATIVHGHIVMTDKEHPPTPGEEREFSAVVQG